MSRRYEKRSTRWSKRTTASNPTASVKNIATRTYRYQSCQTHLALKTNRNETTTRVQVQAQAGDPETANTNAAGDPQAGDPGDPSDPGDPEADPKADPEAEAEPGDIAAEGHDRTVHDKERTVHAEERILRAEASHREKGRQGEDHQGA